MGDDVLSTEVATYTVTAAVAKVTPGLVGSGVRTPGPGHVNRRTASGARGASPVQFRAAPPIFAKENEELIQ